jgi:Flp pilus assembly protein TadG
MLVLFLPVLLTCLYATCGLGALLLARARAQTAADLAALAAAQDVDLERLQEGERRLRPEDAARDAVAWARANLDAARGLFAGDVAPRPGHRGGGGRQRVRARRAG